MQYWGMSLTDSGDYSTPIVDLRLSSSYQVTHKDPTKQICRRLESTPRFGSSTQLFLSLSLLSSTMLFWVLPTFGILLLCVLIHSYSLSLFWATNKPFQGFSPPYYQWCKFMDNQNALLSGKKCVPLATVMFTCMLFVPAVHRLNVELSRYQAKYRPVSFEVCYFNIWAEPDLSQPFQS